MLFSSNEFECEHHDNVFVVHITSFYIFSCYYTNVICFLEIMCSFVCLFVCLSTYNTIFGLRAAKFDMLTDLEEQGSVTGLEIEGLFLLCSVWNFCFKVFHKVAQHYTTECCLKLRLNKAATASVKNRHFIYFCFKRMAELFILSICFYRTDSSWITLLHT